MLIRNFNVSVTVTLGDFAQASRYVHGDLKNSAYQRYEDSKDPVLIALRTATGLEWRKVVSCAMDTEKVYELKTMKGYKVFVSDRKAADITNAVEKGGIDGCPFTSKRTVTLKSVSARKAMAYRNIAALASAR